jgi:hypothetical protein
MLYLAVAALLGYGMRETWPQADLPCILQKGDFRKKPFQTIPSFN